MIEDPLENLNPKQKEAVLEIKEPLIVFAGPGTGKTKMLVSKAAYLIKEKGLKQDEVLALTFSIKAADEMKQRLAKMLGGDQGLRVSTFHAYCLQLLKDYGIYIGLDRDFSVLSEEYQQTILYENIDKLGIKAVPIPARPVELAQTLQGSIVRCKQEGIGPDDLEAYVKGKKEDETVLRLKDLANVYRFYEDYKRKEGMIDYGDMQLFAVQMLQKPDIAAKVRETIKYLLIDEFQDTDYLQLQLIKSLAPGGNVTVVGDDDQSIYRFRGAYITNVLEFTKHYKPKNVVLDTNYRCTKNIQSAAHELIQHNKERHQKEIFTKESDGAPVALTVYQDETTQGEGISANILRLLSTGVDASEIAVLVRKRKDATSVMAAMEARGVAFRQIGCRKYFAEPAVQAAVAYLRIVNDPDSAAVPLFTVMLRPVHGLTPGEVRRLSGHAHRHHLSMWDALKDLAWCSDERSRLKFEAFREDMLKLIKRKADPLPQLVRGILFSKDFFRYEISEGNERNVKTLSKFYEIVTNLTSLFNNTDLPALIKHLEILESLGLEEGEDDARNTVNVLTIHGAKGKEFSHVFIPCLEEGHLPSKFQDYKFEIPKELLKGERTDLDKKQLHLEEERRLLYVALTRGKETVTLSRCKGYEGRKTEAKGSKFLDEMKGRLVEVEPDTLGSGEAAHADSAQKMLRHTLVRGMVSSDWETALKALCALAEHSGAKLSSIPEVSGYLAEVTELYKEPERMFLCETEYSPSRLELYKECPKKFYFRYVLGMPQEEKTYFSLGTAVHSAIEDICKILKEGTVVTEKSALEMLEKHWDSAEYETATKDAEDKESAAAMIRTFLQMQKDSKGTIRDLEKWVVLDLDGKHSVRGKVDRIDEIAGGLRIIDYKTGKTVISKNKLNENLQMALYTLAVGVNEGKSVLECGHWYPHSGKKVMTTFAAEELDTIKKEVIGMIHDIEAGKFETGEGNCYQCDYKGVCGREE